jgi:SAM-dependent methyltransferase
MQQITKKIKEKWDSLYKSDYYAYGTMPNIYFKSFLNKYNPTGKVLLPAEGEGRNGVYAATFGLEVFAFDVSVEGKQKALKLAELHKVNIGYEIGDFLNMEFDKCSFDVVALIYAHFHPKIRSVYHRKILDLLKPNGWLVIEGFSKTNPNLTKQNPEIGSDNLNKFYSINDIKTDFPNFEILELDEEIIELDEGFYHKGRASVIRYLGKKR